MALGTPTLQDVLVAGAVSPQTSGTFTPPANSLLVVVGAVTGTAAANGAMTVSTTITGMGGFTTTSAHTGVATTASGVLAYCLTGSSPSSGTVSVTYANSTPANARMQAFTITGVDTTTPVVGLVSSTSIVTDASSLTVGATPTTADMLLGMFDGRNATPVVGSGFTAILNQGGTGGFASLLAEYKTGVTTTTVDATGLGTIQHTGVALVVKAAAAGSTPPAPAPRIVTRVAGIRANSF